MRVTFRCVSLKKKNGKPNMGAKVMISLTFQCDIEMK